VPGEQIAKILDDGYDTAADRLIAAARDAGGVDNVTVVLGCMEGDGL
jgi:serine/threonine protein phosphatase PrpC